MDVDINTTEYKKKADQVFKAYITVGDTYQFVQADGSKQNLKCDKKPAGYYSSLGPDAMLRTKDGEKTINVYYNSQDGKIHLIAAAGEKEIYYYDSGSVIMKNAP